MDALQSQFIERIAPDTGNLRDDMLTAMLGLGHALEQTTWGGVTAQLLAAAAIDPEMRRIQQSMADHHVAFDSNIIKRAIKRGELSEETEPEHTALLFSAPIFFRHLFTRQATDPKWITAHVDRTIKLITGC